MKSWKLLMVNFPPYRHVALRPRGLCASLYVYVHRRRSGLFLSTTILNNAFNLSRLIQIRAGQLLGNPKGLRELHAANAVESCRALAAGDGYVHAPDIFVLCFPSTLARAHHIHSKIIPVL